MQTGFAWLVTTRMNYCHFTILYVEDTALVLCLIEAKLWLACWCWSWKERKAMGDAWEILAATHTSLPFPWYTMNPRLWLKITIMWTAFAVIWCWVYFWKSKCCISAKSITCQYLLKSIYDCSLVVLYLGCVITSLVMLFCIYFLTYYKLPVGL